MTVQHTRTSVRVKKLRVEFLLYVATGGHQGDPLSATAFNLVMDSVI